MKRIVFWSVFLIILVLILWGLSVALKKSASGTPGLPTGTPAPVTAADHIRGPVDAPVTLIEYGDFQCPACEAYYPLEQRVFDSSSTTMRWVFRHFPLSQHPNAVPAATAAEAAGAQGKYWDMSDMLFLQNADWTGLSDPTPVFVGYATKLGLNIPEFKADLSSSTLQAVINADEQEGESLGISYTPTFFVNGKAIANPQSYDQFKAIIDAAASGGSR